MNDKMIIVTVDGCDVAGLFYVGGSMTCAITLEGVETSAVNFEVIGMWATRGKDALIHRSSFLWPQGRHDIGRGICLK